MKERTAREIIEALEKKYANDEEAMEVINRTKEDIEYIEEREKEGDYTGQPAVGRALETEDTLATWY
ncbi:hypothetical protein [Frisingicoccus sp.]